MKAPTMERYSLFCDHIYRFSPSSFIHREMISIKVFIDAIFVIFQVMHIFWFSFWSKTNLNSLNSMGKQDGKKMQFIFKMFCIERTKIFNKKKHVWFWVKKLHAWTNTFRTNEMKSIKKKTKRKTNCKEIFIIKRWHIQNKHFTSLHHSKRSIDYNLSYAIPKCKIELSK